MEGQFFPVLRIEAVSCQQLAAAARHFRQMARYLVIARRAEAAVRHSRATTRAPRSFVTGDVTFH